MSKNSTPAHLGPLWALYERMIVGRRVRSATGPHKEGYVAMEPFQDPEQPFRLMTQVKWSSGHVEDVLVSELLQKSMLLPAFVEDPQLVHPKVLNLQRTNWADAKLVAELQARNVYVQRLRSASQKPGQQAAMRLARLRNVKDSTSIDVEIAPAAAKPSGAQPGSAPEQAPAAGPASPPPASTPLATSPSVDPGVPGSLEPQLQAASTLLQMAMEAAQEHSKKRSWQSVVNDDEQQRVQQVQRTSSAGKRMPHVIESDEDVSHDTGEHFSPGHKADHHHVTSGPAAGLTTPGSSEDQGDSDGDHSSLDSQPDYRDTRRWVRGWTGIYYPAHIVKRPGDIPVHKGHADSEGEYSWDTIMDVYTDADGRRWVLLKWTGYELDPGRGRQYLQADIQPEPGLRGHWELADQTFDKAQFKMFKKWLKGNQPQWYKQQIE